MLSVGFELVSHGHARFGFTHRNLNSGSHIGMRRGEWQNPILNKPPAQRMEAGESGQTMQDEDKQISWIRAIKCARVVPPQLL